MQNVSKSFHIADLLALSLVPGVGPKTIQTLLIQFETPANSLQALFKKEVVLSGRPEVENPAVYLEKAYQILAECTQKNIEVLAYWDENYPRALFQLPDPPSHLFFQGQLSQVQSKLMAVVGTRTPTHYGRAATAEWVSQLSQSGWGILSGLALGIDTIAHQTALKFSAPTVAVLGSGLNHVYPQVNIKLYEKVIQHGLALSEYPPGTQPNRHQFPRRNRIIAALGQELSVMESKEVGGAMITAQYAEQLNKTIWALPGSVYSPSAFGPLKLIQNGAKVIHPGNTSAFTQTKGAQLSQPEAQVLKLLRPSATLEEIQNFCQEKSYKAIPLLSSLEKKGLIHRQPGSIYTLEA